LPVSCAVAAHQLLTDLDHGDANTLSDDIRARELNGCGCVEQLFSLLMYEITEEIGILDHLSGLSVGGRFAIPHATNHAGPNDRRHPPIA
jgi:hypothetical protein